MNSVEYIKFKDLNIPTEFIITESPYEDVPEGTFYKIKLHDNGIYLYYKSSSSKNRDDYPVGLSSEIFYYFILTVKYEPCSYDRFLNLKVFL